MTPVEWSAGAGLPDFDGFVAARSPSLLAAAALLTGDRHRAEDLLQTALAKAYLRWSRIRPSGHELRRALADLPGRQRATVVLRFYLDLSEADTAAAMGCSVGTVKSQTARALSRLRHSPALSSLREGDRP